MKPERIENLLFLGVLGVEVLGEPLDPSLCP